jgi:acetyl-CoA acetyltransferase
MLEWELPYGLRLPMGPYAMAASRHMADFGTTSEQLAQIAVSTREWAALNPRARYRDRISIDDVLASPMQTSPLHLLDCCLVTDGAGAFVMTSAERAKDLRRPQVYVLGAGT